MNRDEVLDKLARGRDKWFVAFEESLPSWAIENGLYLAVECGFVTVFHPHVKNWGRDITKSDWRKRRIELGLEKKSDPEVTPEEDEAWSEARMDAIGQNGGEALHYDVTPVEGVEFTDSAIGTGLKYDGDKVRMDLLTDGMPRALEAVGEILTFGAKKYKAHSWKTVAGNDERYNAAKVRHMIARAKGEERDPESGLLHLAHEACNALFLLELALLEGEE